MWLATREQPRRPFGGAQHGVLGWWVAYVRTCAYHPLSCCPARLGVLVHPLRRTVRGDGQLAVAMLERLNRVLLLCFFFFLTALRLLFPRALHVHNPEGVLVRRLSRLAVCSCCQPVLRDTGSW